MFEIPNLQPEPFKSSSSSPPENSSIISETSRTKRPPIFLDHIALQLRARSNILNRRKKIDLPPSVLQAFHKLHVYLTPSGSLQFGSKYQLSSNGKKIYQVAVGATFEEPRRHVKSYDNLSNQMTVEQKENLLSLACDKTPYQWQVEKASEALGEVLNETLDSMSKSYKDASIQVEGYCSPRREFYVELPVVSHDSRVQEALNRSINSLHGNTVEAREYGNGAQFWFVNEFEGIKFKDLKIKTYQKGDFIRLEIQQGNPLRCDSQVKLTEALLRNGYLAELILNQILDRFEDPPKVYSRPEIEKAVLESLPRSSDSIRVQKMITSFAETGAYKPKSFGRKRVSRHHISKLLADGKIEPILDNRRKELRRMPSNISYRWAIDKV